MKQSPPRPVSFDYLLVEDRTNMELSPPVPAPLAAPPTKPRISPFAPSHPTAYSNSPSSNVPSTHGHVHSLPPPPNYSPPSFLAGMLPSSSSSSRLMNKLPTVNPPLPTTNRRISAFSHASASSTASSRTNSGANTPSIVEPLTTHEPNRMVAAVIESEKSSTATRKKTPEEIVCDSLCELQRSHPARPTTTTTPLHEIAPSISISSCESSTVIEGGGKRKRARSRDPVSTSPPLPPPLRTSSVESGLPPREDLVEFDSNGIPKKELKQTKRAAQNRAAQRAFRERKEQHIR
ncbi:uncharacterized protein JCM15063_006327 [Sporobolomyces koalae]|uniref:uncharacterized protein n=1 Tax=Sporobolomyces koalae TaxID=500713 RepID=UPI003182978A